MGSLTITNSQNRHTTNSEKKIPKFNQIQTRYSTSTKCAFSACNAKKKPNLFATCPGLAQLVAQTALLVALFFFLGAKRQKNRSRENAFVRFLLSGRSAFGQTQKKWEHFRMSS